MLVVLRIRPATTARRRSGPVTPSGFLLLVAALAILATTGSAAGTYRGQHVYVPDNADASQVLFRPSRWTPTGDGSLRFVRIRWSSYDGRVARATGIAISSSCEPSCADGHITRQRVKLVLSMPRIFKCARGTYVYSRLQFSPRLPNRPSAINFTFCSNRFGP